VSEQRRKQPFREHTRSTLRSTACLHRHELDCVVAHVLDARQHVVLEVRVGGDAGLLAAHAHVRLVDAQRLGAGRARVAPHVPLRRRRVPVDAVVLGTHDALRDGGPLDPSGDAVHPPAARVAHADLHAAAVRDGACRQPDAPGAKVVALHRLPLPAVEVADDLRLRRPGRPLAVHLLALRGGRQHAQRGDAGEEQQLLGAWLRGCGRARRRGMAEGEAVPIAPHLRGQPMQLLQGTMSLLLLPEASPSLPPLKSFST
jgi:hypothetical protein